MGQGPPPDQDMETGLALNACRRATPDPHGSRAKRLIKPTFANRVFRQAPLHSIRRMRPNRVRVADPVERRLGHHAAR